MCYLCGMKLKICVLGCIFSLFFIANSKTVSAQQYIYKGKVADHQSEEPLPFVAVSYVKDKIGDKRYFKNSKCWLYNFVYSACKNQQGGPRYHSFICRSIEAGGSGKIEVQ